VTRPHRARHLLSPLWLLVALTTLLGLNVSSAATTSGPETRVRASEHVAADVVGQQSDDGPASAGCLRPPPPASVSGSCVATNTADDLLSSGRQVSGRFPQVGGADEVLLRRGADGSITHCQVYGPDGLPIRRVDLTGRSHGGVPTPHVVEFERHVNPVTGEVFVRRSSTVRPALPGEIPGAG
jgi:hypothetical protein